jgi:hypothetical protein
VTDEESFYSQNKKKSPQTDFKKSHSHRALGMGENIWFRIFTGTKTGPKWKRGVVIGRGEDIEGIDKSTTVMNIYPSHHYTIWDLELEFITSQDIHHIRPMYTQRQKRDLLIIIDKIKKSESIRNHFDLDKDTIVKNDETSRPMRDYGWGNITNGPKMEEIEKWMNC